MQTEKFQRKPFIVDAVQVTNENMEEVAKWCNGTITKSDTKVAETLKKPVQTWIQVETQQPMNDRQKQAFAGDWILYANRGFKIYTPKAFERTFDPVFQEKRQIEERGPVKIHVDEKRPTPKDIPRKPGGYAETSKSHDLSPEEVERLEQKTVEVQQKGTDHVVKVTVEELAAAGIEVLPTGQAHVQ